MFLAQLLNDEITRKINTCDRAKGSKPWNLHFCPWNLHFSRWRKSKKAPNYPVQKRQKQKSPQKLGTL